MGILLTTLIACFGKSYCVYSLCMFVLEPCSTNYNICFMTEPCRSFEPLYSCAYCGEQQAYY